MKSLILILFSLFIFNHAFSQTVKEDASTKKYHEQFCTVIKKALPKTDYDTCVSTGSIVLGGYDSEEVVYQLHKIRLFKNSTKEYYCIVTGGEGGLFLESCTDWAKVGK